MPKDDKQRSLDILGLLRNASKNDIRLAFFKKSLYSHPDAMKNINEMATFSEVAHAYNYLSEGAGLDSTTPDQVFFKFFQEVLNDDNVHSLRAMLQEQDAAKCADDEYRCDEDDNEIDIEREFERLLEILKNRKKKGKEIPDDMTHDKVLKCRDSLVRQREEAKRDPKKQVPKKGKQQQVPVSKPKPKSKKQLLAEQRRRDKEMEKIAVELEKKKKEDEEKEKTRKQLETEKQKRLEEEKKKIDAEARRQREREQKERERLQKLEQERERKQKEEEERRRKEEMKRKKAEQERVEKDKADKAAKLKAAQQAAKEKEEQGKNSSKSQNLKRNQPQRNDQTYPREIPPRFQRRMKQQQQQQQQQSVFPQQLPSTSSSQITPAQPQTIATAMPTVQPKTASKSTPTAPVGKKKDPQRWTKGEYTGIIEDIQDDSGWSKAPPAKTSEDWDDTTEDWGCEGTPWDEKPNGDERVIVDKTDKDSWPTVGVKATNGEEISANVENVLEKENMCTFGDSLDAVIDGMEAAEEAAGTDLLNSGQWTQQTSSKDIKLNNSSNFSKELETTQTWSKVPGKEVKLKGNTENTSDSASNTLDDTWKECTSVWDESASGWNESASTLKQTTSVSKQDTSGWQEQPVASGKWNAVGNTGIKTELTPKEETGWGESSANKRNGGNNWGASWSAQGLSLTGTEIWDQSSADGSAGKGSDWTSEDSTNKTETGWESVGQHGDDEGHDWNSWSTAGSKRNKAPKPNPGNDENAWLRRSLKQLVDMGFKEVDGEKALRSNNMSLEAAISQLLGVQGAQTGNQSPMGIDLSSGHSSEAISSTQLDGQDITKLNRKQRRRLLQQPLGTDVAESNSDTESSEAPSVTTNMPLVSSKVAEGSRIPNSNDSPVEYTADSNQSEQPDAHSDRNISNVNTGNVIASTSGSGQVAGSEPGVGSVVTTTSGSLPSVRPLLPAVYQQQLIQQQRTHLQQLHLAPPTGLMRSPLATQPVVLLRQLSQLRLFQQQLAGQQQQLLQKQSRANTLQAQQLALQQQHIATMMQQIQQQLIQQQQSQQQQQLMGSNQLATPAQQTLLAAQPQHLQPLLLQQRKQQQQQQEIQQVGKQTAVQLPQKPTEPETNSRSVEDNSSGDIKSISPRTSMAKEPASLVQVVNSAPASPSTGKSRLGQWTQNSIQSERLSPKIPETGGRDRNLRASPLPDASERSLLTSRSTNSPNLIQTTANSASVHRVLDPVSSRWGIDAAPKLSAEPPEFKPGVPWRPYQAKTSPELALPETPATTARMGSQDWTSGNCIGSQTVSSSFNNTQTNSRIQAAAPLKTVPNSQNFPQNPSSAIWQSPVSRQPDLQRSNPLSSNIRPPPGLGDENSFLNLPVVHSQSGDTNWSAHSEAQIISGTQFGISAPGFQPWPTNERRESGWRSTSAVQTLDTLPPAPRVSELRTLTMMADSNRNNGGIRVKPEMPNQQSSYSGISTWLVIRNINPRVDSTELRSLCQQHGPLLTFQLNLRYGNSLIRYGNKEEAAKAHAHLNSLVLAGSRLSADFATDSDIGSFFEQNSDWSVPQPTTTWANAPTALVKTEPSTQWPGSKPLFPSSELWSYSQAGGLAGGVWSTPPTSRREGDQSATVTENGITSPSMVTFLPPGLLNSGEST